MEFTQLLRVGLELAVGLNAQYSHPVCMRSHSHAHATVNDMQENSWGSSNGNGIHHLGILKNAGTRKHVNDLQTRQIDELW